MKDETKEILNKLLEYFKESDINDFGYEEDKLISYEEAQILLDYITNLQEENKILKELNVCVGCNNNSDYKSRIDKAVEYIENDLKSFLYSIEYKTLLNILQGSDK